MAGLLEEVIKCLRQREDESGMGMQASGSPNSERIVFHCFATDQTAAVLEQASRILSTQLPDHGTVGVTKNEIVRVSDVCRQGAKGTNERSACSESGQPQELLRSYATRYLWNLP